MQFPKRIRSTIPLLALFSSLFPGTSEAACDNCPEIDVGLYDLDVQVPVDTSSAAALSEWWRLHFAAGWVAGTVGDDRCTNFFDGAMFSDTSGSPSPTLTIGVGHAHLPPRGNMGMSGQDYLLTGSISSAGGGYRMDLRLETSCSREVAASASGSFATPGEANATAVRLATQAFTPLSTKIREFEKQKRDSDPEVAIDICKDAFQILPSKTTATPSETFPVTISLKDCDGTPLAGRKIELMGGSFKGSALAPSTNGIFTQLTATTDGQGKATVDYTTGPSKGLSVARVHFVYKSPAGCEQESEAIASINVQSTAAYYKVYFEYTEDYTRRFDTTVISGGGTQNMRVNGFSNLALSGTAIAANDPDAVAEGTISLGGPALHAALSEARYRARRLEEDRMSLSGAGVYMNSVKTELVEHQGASAVTTDDKVEIDFTFDPQDPTNTGTGGIAVPMRRFGKIRDFMSEYVSAAGHVTKDTSSVEEREDTTDWFASASSPAGRVVAGDSVYTIEYSTQEDFRDLNVPTTKTTRLKMVVSPISVNRPSGLDGYRSFGRGMGQKLTVRRSGSSLLVRMPHPTEKPATLRLMDLRGTVLRTSTVSSDGDGWIRWTSDSFSQRSIGLVILQVDDGRTQFHAPVVLN